MTLAATLAKFRLSLDDLVKAARAEVAQRKNAAKALVSRGLSDAETQRAYVAEAEAIAEVLENLKLGQTYAEQRP